MQCHSTITTCIPPPSHDSVTNIRDLPSFIILNCTRRDILPLLYLSLLHLLLLLSIRLSVSIAPLRPCPVPRSPDHHALCESGHSSPLFLLASFLAQSSCDVTQLRSGLHNNCSLIAQSWAIPTSYSPRAADPLVNLSIERTEADGGQFDVKSNSTVAAVATCQWARNVRPLRRCCCLVLRRHFIDMKFNREVGSCPRCWVFRDQATHLQVEGSCESPQTRLYSRIAQPTEARDREEMDQEDQARRLDIWREPDRRRP